MEGFHLIAPIPYYSVKCEPDLPTDIHRVLIRTNVTTTDHRTAIDRRSAMTVYLGFNKTDGYYGWNSELSGYTVFYNWMEGIGTVKA